MSDNSIMFFLDWIITDFLLIIAFYNVRQLSLGRAYMRIPTASFIFFCTLLGTFSIVSPDYVGYRNMLGRLSLYGMSNDVEPIYWYIAKIINYDIIYYRLLLIGVYMPLITIVIKLFNFRLQLVYNIFLIVLYFSVTTVIRSSLADVIMWLGILLYLRNRSGISFLCMISFCAIGLILHKSSFMVIVLLLLSLISLRKIQIQLFILAIPLAVIILKIAIPYIFSNYFETSHYDQAQIISSSIGFIKIVFNTIFTLLFGLYILFIAKKYCTSDISKKMYRCVFWGFYFLVIFQFSGVSRFVGERFYAHASIPLFYLISLILMKGSRRVKRQTIICLLLFLVLGQLGILVVWAYHAPALQSNTYL